MAEASVVMPVPRSPQRSRMADPPDPDEGSGAANVAKGIARQTGFLLDRSGWYARVPGF